MQYRINSSLYLFLFIICMLGLQGCAKRQVLTPDYRGYDLRMLIDELKEVASIESALEVQYERGDALMNGDMFVKADKEDMVLRFYYMGLPAGEIVQKDGIVKGTLKIGKAKAEMLIEGLKSSIFWWNSEYDETFETEGAYILRGIGREVVIDKKTMLPINQRVTLANGEIINIAYSVPSQLYPEGPPKRPTDWYQSEMLIEYRDYRVRAKITSLTVYRQ